MPPSIVVGTNLAPPEKTAAEDLQTYLKQLFDIDAPIQQAPDDASDAFFIVGNPSTNPHASAGWREVEEQGIVLRRCELAGKPAVLVGGGSPAATLWAVSRLAEQYGVVHLLHGDVYPHETVPFHLPDLDLAEAPSLPFRCWRVINDCAWGPESWGLADYAPVLHQLAKMSINRIFICIYPYQPFVDLQIEGLRRDFTTLFYDFHYPITDDMPGRGIFDDEGPEYWNPDFPPRGSSFTDFHRAARQHLEGIIETAHELGMSAVMIVPILEFPPEFAPILPDAQRVQQLGQLTVVPGPNVAVDDERLYQLAATVLQAYVNTYPQIDEYWLDTPEFVSWTDVYEEAWQSLNAKYDLDRIITLEDLLDQAKAHDVVYDDGQRGRAITEAKANVAALQFVDRLVTDPDVLPKTCKPDARCALKAPEQFLPLTARIFHSDMHILQNLAYTPARALRRPEAIRRSAANVVTVFSLHDDNIGVLPQLCTGSLHAILTAMKPVGWQGFVTRYWQVADHDPAMLHLTRACWDESVTPEDSYRHLIEGVCGPSAVAPMLEAFRILEAVTVDLENHGMGLAFPVPEMGTKLFQPEPMPPELHADRDAYRRAAECVRRVPMPDHQAGRDYLAYWLGRFEFAVQYFDFIETMHAAGTAHAAVQAGDTAHRIEDVEDMLATAEAQARKAIEIHVPICKDRSDKGAVAIMAEYLVRDVARLRESLA